MRYDLEKVKEEMRDAPPLSSEGQLDEFLKSSIYADMKKELQVWEADITDLIVQGGDERTVDNLRGCIAGVRRALKFAEYLREQIHEQREKANQNYDKEG